MFARWLVDCALMSEMPVALTGSLRQMLEFGRKKLDLEYYSHFSFDSFLFCFTQNPSLKKMKLIQIVFFSLFRSSEVKIGSRIGLQIIKEPGRSELLPFI